MANHPGLMIVITLTAAMLLRVFRWPLDAWLFSPDWVLLVVIFWTLTKPGYFGVGSAWLVGLLTDVLTGHLLGQFALTYTLIAYICLLHRHRLRLMPPVQQTITILLILLLGQASILWIEQLQHSFTITALYWAPSLTGALLWPLLSYLLHRLSRAGDLQ